MRVDLSEGLFFWGVGEIGNENMRRAGGRYEAIKWFFRFSEYILLLMVSPVYMYSEGRLGIVMRLG